MNVLPVIVRELRAQSRQRFTFSLRELGVFAMLVSGGLFALSHPLAARSGGELFAYLHRTLFFAIWILVPFSAADCISRERREGTLGLLFLTPLRPTDIVIAKGLAHGLRALTLLVAVLPVMTIPFLLGGVSWQQAAFSTVINLSAAGWALAATLVASALSRNGLRAMVMAGVLGVGALMVFLVSTGLLTQFLGFPGLRRRGVLSPYIWLLGMSSPGFTPRGWGGPATPFPLTLALPGLVKYALLSLLVFLAGLVVAASCIKRNWREEPPPGWVSWCQRIFCTPVLWLTFFRWWMRRRLNHNPIGWLEQRTWTGRLVTWSWFAVVISLYSVALTDSNFFRDYRSFQTLLAWLMIGSIAASAAGSFRRERESGVLELLLVAPLSANQIISGRLRGLWGQFLPSMGLLLGVWLYFARLLQPQTGSQDVLYFALSFLALPVIGLYFSVRCRNYISAFLLTLACGVLGPFILSRLVIMGLWTFNRSTATQPVTISCLVLILLAVYFGLKLRWRLETRKFPLERTTF